MACIYLRNGIYQVKFKRHGRWRRKSLKTRDRETALEMMRDIVDQVAVADRPDDPSALTIDSLIERLEDWAKHHLSERTLYQRVHALRNWQDVTGRKYIADVTVDDVDEYKDDLLEAGKSPRTINDRLKLLRIAVNLAARRFGYQGPNAFREADYLRIDEMEPQWIETRAEIDRLLEAAAADSPAGHLFVAQCLLQGHRKRESVNALWQWHKFDRGVSTIASAYEFRTKNRRLRTVPMHDQLTAILEVYRRPDGHVIAPEKGHDPAYYRVDIRKRFRRIAKAAELPWITPKTLRHTFASQLASNGVELYKIQKWLGHADPRTTQIYAHLRPADPDINRL